MCITSRRASLSGTKILSFPKENGNVFLSYSNSVVNYASGKNCMILPIPGQPKPESFYDTTLYKDFMGYIGNRTIVAEGLNFGEGMKQLGMKSRSLSKNMTEVKVGMYTVQICTIQGLTELQTKENIGLTTELLSFFETHYKGFIFVCCFFDSKEKMDAQPIAFDYIPNNKNMLFYPTMDSHSGGAPRNGTVEVDHMIIAPRKPTSLIYPKSVDTSFIKAPEFLNNREWATYKIEKNYQNGDTYFDLTQDLNVPNLKRSYETII